MKKLLLSLALLLTTTAAQAQTLAPGDIPASVLVNVTAAAVVAQPLTVLVCDATANDIAVTLPDATQVAVGKGVVVMMVKTGSSHYVSFVTVSSQKINTLSAADFTTTYKLVAPATSMSFVSNGTNYVASAGTL